MPDNIQVDPLNIGMRPGDQDSPYNRIPAAEGRKRWKRGLTIAIPTFLAAVGASLFFFQPHPAVRVTGIIVFAAGAAMLGVMIRRGVIAVIRVRRQLRGACGHCGHAISGTPISICSKCGHDPFER